MKIDQRMEYIRVRRTQAMMEARDLELRVRDPASKHRVQEKVVRPLDDVETLFLGPAENDARSLHQLSKWLNGAEQHLTMALDHLKHYQALFQEYPSDLTRR